MLEEELYEEIYDSQDVSQRYFGISLWKFFVLCIIVVIFGIYISILMFGTNSFDVLLDLQDYELYLQNEVMRLKTENAQLQKEYFELKELSAK
jgi:hypothetical protein